MNRSLIAVFLIISINMFTQDLYNWKWGYLVDTEGNVKQGLLSVECPKYDYIFTGFLEIVPGDFFTKFDHVIKYKVNDTSEVIEYRDHEVLEFQYDKYYFERIRAYGHYSMLLKLIDGNMSLYKTRVSQDQTNMKKYYSTEKGFPDYLVNFMNHTTDIPVIFNLEDLPAERYCEYIISVEKSNMYLGTWDVELKNEQVFEAFRAYPELYSRLKRGEFQGDIFKAVNRYNMYMNADPELLEVEKKYKRDKLIFNNDSLLMMSAFDSTYEIYQQRIWDLLRDNIYVEEYIMDTKSYGNGNPKYIGFKVLLNKEGLSEKLHPIGVWRYYTRNGELYSERIYNIKGAVTSFTNFE